MSEKSMKVTGKHLTFLKDAEAAIAREEVKGLDGVIPDGHPLRRELERQKAMLGGDLSRLPPGHPLLRALEAAKKSVEGKLAAEKGEGSGVRDAKETTAGEEKNEARSVVKRAKKPDHDAAKRLARRQEEEAQDRRKEAVSEVNGVIDRLLEASRELQRVVSENEQILNNDAFSRAKTARLRRIVFAAERGVSECRIARF